MNKKTSYSIVGVNLFFTLRNRVPLKHFYSKLYFRAENRVELEMPLRVECFDMHAWFMGGGG